MFDKTKKNFETEVNKFARKNILKKLEDQGIEPSTLSTVAFNELLEDEIELLKDDSKKVGVGIGIGILFSLVTGI